ncbi:Elongation factor P hydroxylase [Zhongshania aliphaticivorans]|uniref:Elongation factor P hydroxylase n=1 Tax=Zhongshania aliphaticivorans TaxID=1470434 RepID=A0A5S9NZN1_9GAMM|nr:elongation factor P hydroxylase [Zhongshania aliphaticivorans]CAA0096328.1 Elongation factor P hydroxylase [Zhongshania aliphaticivorans]
MRFVEFAHWCIAGERRRQQVDYGYWYEPDGRSLEQQRIFESVEAKPQALEWMFSVAAGLPFRVSIDNLTGSEIDPFPFQLAVWQSLNYFLANEMPPRAALFLQALRMHFGTAEFVASHSYKLGDIS